MYKPVYILLFTLVTTVLAQTETEVGPGQQDFTMTWIVIGVVGAVAVTLALVFCTYCCGGWWPNCSLCCKKDEEKSELSETATLITPSSKTPTSLDNMLQIPKVPETPPVISTEEGTEELTNTVTSGKPLDNVVDTSTQLENILK